MAHQVTTELPARRLEQVPSGLRTGTAALYIQDRWTRGRLTLSGALRWDRASSYAPVEGNGVAVASRFNAAPITIEQTPGVDAYNDLSPRFGVGYDVFGNGKTALKLRWGRYLGFASNDQPYTSTNPAATPVNKAMMALKGGNAVVIAPSPAGYETTATTVDLMRAELKKLQTSLGISFVHVTHSQEEAMALADLIVVMNDESTRFHWSVRPILILWQNEANRLYPSV